MMWAGGWIEMKQVEMLPSHGAKKSHTLSLSFSQTHTRMLMLILPWSVQKMCRPVSMSASLISWTSCLQLFTTTGRRQVKGLMSKKKESPGGIWMVSFYRSPLWGIEPVHSEEMSIIYCQTPMRKLFSSDTKHSDFSKESQWLKTGCVCGCQTDNDLASCVEGVRSEVTSLLWSCVCYCFADLGQVSTNCISCSEHFLSHTHKHTLAWSEGSEGHFLMCWWVLSDLI